ncbi:MAG TPA: MATE family efflux transporter [Candidatus Nitrosopolaris sp.]|nr:MATE family efflux transporter [Candidatus Nitrosopolaris sp.]
MATTTNPAAVAEATGVAPDSARELQRATWALAWPVIFSFSIESFVGLCDMLMVGRLGPLAVAGVGVGVQILGAVDSLMFAVGTGTLAIVARQVGARDLRGAEETLGQSILAAMALSLLAIVPVRLWAPALVSAFRIQPEVVPVGAAFLRTVMLGVPGGAALFVVVASLRGAGDTRSPLLIGCVVGVVNVALAYVLIFGHLGLPALGVAGAAIATAIAFASGAILGLALLARGRLVLALRGWPLPPRTDVIRRVLRIGYPAAIEHLLMQIGFFLYIVFAAHYGTAAVAAYFIGVRILALSFLPGFGFAAAAATLIGQSLGAGSPRQAERSGREAVRLAVRLMTACGIVIFIAARPIARLFVNDEAVVTDAVSFIRVLAACQPLMATDFTLGGALRGAGDTRFPLAAVFLGFYVCRLGFAGLVTFALGLSVPWLWLALVGDYLVRSALKGWRFRSGTWKQVVV